MKKQILFLLVLAIGTIAYAQKKPKIQGNKVVVDIYNTLGEFSAIEVSDDLEVTLTQTESNGYHLKTDENLAPIIKFDIEDEVLKIYAVNRITSSKKLEIDVTFKNINELMIKGDTKLKSMNRLKLDTLDFTARDNAFYELDIEVNDGTFILNKNTKGELLLRGDKVQMILNDNSFLESEMVLNDLDIEINKRSDIDLSGDVKNLKLTATGSSEIKAKKLKSTFADLIASNTADIYVYASKELKLYAQGKSYIYVYGNPDIQVDGLNDKSRIIKK